MSHWKLSLSKVWLLVPLLSLLLVVVGCGAAATATPTPTKAPAAPVAAPAAATPAPTLAAVPKAAPTPTPISEPAANIHPGKLTIMLGDLGTERFDQSFSPLQTAGNNYGRIMGGFLISDNEKRDLVPGIASQWGVSADGLTWTFTIRKGVKFHDGSELTPQDVLWTLQHYTGPQASEYATGTLALTYSRLMDRIELSGPDKVSVTSKVPVIDFAPIVSEAATHWYHVMPKRAKLHDTEVALAYDDNPIGAGPMRLAKRVPAYVMKFQRFDDFYYQPKNGFPEDKRVNFQSLDLFLVIEESTRVAAVRAGEADLVGASVATKKQVEAGGGRLVFGQEGVVAELKLIGCWDLKLLPPCRDKRVRQALNYAVDKEVARDKLYGGPTAFQIKGWQIVTPSTIGYTPEVDPWPFDPNKARQLLADAGYPGGKGFGKLIMNTSPSSAMPLQVEATQLVADTWKRELGLDVEVKVEESTSIRKRERAGELNGQLIWKDNETRKYAEAKTRSVYGDTTHKSPTRLTDDEELIRLVQETLVILDEDKRAEALKKVHVRLRDESYELGYGFLNIPWGVGPRVLTWRPYPVAYYPSALHTITLK